MARRRRGTTVKAVRQSRRGKKDEKLNGLTPNSDAFLEDSKDCLESDSGNGVSAGNNYAIDNSTTGDQPIVHHKKFGKIRVSGQSENSVDMDSGKDYGRFDSKSSDENESETLENNRYPNDSGMVDIMREISVPKGGQNSFSDFRKQSSVYKAENDIPLDGSVIIKPGTFSSNTITTSVKSNVFYDPPPNTELSSVNFLKVLQGIEMLERNVSGTTSPLEYGSNTIKEEKEYLINQISLPLSTTEEPDRKVPYTEEENQLEGMKQEPEEESCESAVKIVGDIKVEENVKDIEIGSPDDVSSDMQMETEETARKLQDIILDDTRETSGSPASKASDETSEKKQPGSRNRTGSTDTAGSESSSSCGATIRRSNRIRSIGIMKQKEREQAAVRSECVIKSPLPPGSPAIAPPAGFEDKPVKVKSRWRRSSELEMHKVVDSESLSSSCTSPVNVPNQIGGTYEPTPEDLERMEREKKDIEEGLKSFSVITENEYKMERCVCIDYLTYENICTNELH